MNNKLNLLSCYLLVLFLISCNEVNKQSFKESNSTAIDENKKNNSMTAKDKIQEFSINFTEWYMSNGANQYNKNEVIQFIDSSMYFSEKFKLDLTTHINTLPKSSDISLPFVMFSFISNQQDDLEWCNMVTFPCPEKDSVIINKHIFNIYKYVSYPNYYAEGAYFRRVNFSLLNDTNDGVVIDRIEFVGEEKSSEEFNCEFQINTDHYNKLVYDEYFHQLVMDNFYHNHSNVFFTKFKYNKTKKEVDNTVLSEINLNKELVSQTPSKENAHNASLENRTNQSTPPYNKLHTTALNLARLYERDTISDFINRPYTNLAGGIRVSQSQRIKGFYAFEFTDLIEEISQLKSDTYLESLCSIGQVVVENISQEKYQQAYENTQIWMAELVKIVKVEEMAYPSAVNLSSQDKVIILA
jgi:hypothetical protein